MIREIKKNKINKERITASQINNRALGRKIFKNSALNEHINTTNCLSDDR